jgi:dGTP triphosphohydrolase
MITRLFEFYLANTDRLGAVDGPPHRAVCDYIAGMTDGFLLRSYEQVFG